MKNRFFTVMIIPEQTNQVRRFIVPAWVLRGAVFGSFFIAILGTIMVLDYWFVMSQVSENKALKVENRRLRQQVQVFNNKMQTVESTMERIKTFATRLKVITNIEDRGDLVQNLNQKLPDAAANIGTSPNPLTGAQENALKQVAGENDGTQSNVALADDDPENIALKHEYHLIDTKFSELNQETMMIEQILQDQYELLADQKAFLSALPTRKPAIGYYTSGFGVRRSPFGGLEKMHEGLDIANYPGTPIHATADGKVLWAETKPGYGQVVILDHGYGLETWYGHTKKILVKKGQQVRRGQEIALLGNTGRSTGPHLHYEVRVRGTPVDPLSYILEN